MLTCAAFFVLPAACRILLVVDPGADSILLEVRKAVSESHDDVYEFELKAVEALLSVSSKRLVSNERECNGRRRNCYLFGAAAVRPNGTARGATLYRT